MNPFASPDTNTLRRINLRLRARLPATRHGAIDDDPSEVTTEAAVRHTSRPYAPTGHVSRIIDALVERGPMTSKGVERVTGVPAKQVHGALRAAYRHGVVVIDSRNPVVWRAAT